MSLGGSAALQGAVYQWLLADAALAALVGDRIYDAVPPGGVTATYVSLGPEDVREAGDRSGPGARHDFTVSVVTDEAGFSLAKEVAVAISDRLDGADLTLARGRLVGLWFLQSRARRVETGTLRRIDLSFRARIEL